MRLLRLFRGSGKERPMQLVCNTRLGLIRSHRHSTFDLKHDDGRTEPLTWEQFSGLEPLADGRTIDMNRVVAAAGGWRTQ